MLTETIRLCVASVSRRLVRPCCQAPQAACRRIFLISGSTTAASTSCVSPASNWRRCGLTGRRRFGHWWTGRPRAAISGCLGWAAIGSAWANWKGFSICPLAALDKTSLFPRVGRPRKIAFLAASRIPRPNPMMIPSRACGSGEAGGQGEEEIAFKAAGPAAFHHAAVASWVGRGHCGREAVSGRRGRVALALRFYGLGPLAVVQRHGLSLQRENPDFWNFLIPGVGMAPVTQFCVLISVFVIAIGPVNYWVLRRRRKLHLLLLTIPASAAVVTGLLFGYALLADGLGVRVRARSVTNIDQRSDRAICWTRLSYFAGLRRTAACDFPPTWQSCPWSNCPRPNTTSTRCRGR